VGLNPIKGKGKVKEVVASYKGETSNGKVSNHPYHQQSHKQLITTAEVEVLVLNMQGKSDKTREVGGGQG